MNIYDDTGKLIAVVQTDCIMGENQLAYTLEYIEKILDI